MPPRYPWGEGSFSEEMFRNQDMAYEVRSDTLRRNASKLSDERRTLSVPITHLSHCTHNEQVRQIEDNDEYRCFKSCLKTPRENSHEYNIESRTTKKLFGKQSVLPGYLSWWGISTIEWYEGDDPRGIETKKIVKTLQAKKYGGAKETIFVPPYLQSCIQEGEACANSVYGGNSFSCPIRKLIESYRQSRSENAKIYFKKAGTLRYRHEICYVILVCTEEDLQNEDISSMPGAGEPDINVGRRMKYFNLSDESIDPDGKLKKTDIKPEFISEYPIRAIYTGPPVKRVGRFYSWDTLNFAFYYPEPHLRVKKDDIIRAPTLHDEQSCHLGNCPDVIRR